MPLPNPSYLTNIRYQWNGNTRSSAVLDIPTGYITSINWEGTDVYQRQRFHDLIMTYAVHNGQTEANALTAGFPCGGWQEMDFGGTVVGTNPSGLSARIYTASVTFDGSTTPVALSVDGTTATTFTTVLAAINAIIGAGSPIKGVAQISPTGNLEIVSHTTGVTSSVVISDVDLFSSLSGYVSMGSQYIGATAPIDILDVNELYGINIGNPIREQFFGILETIPNKPVLTRNTLTSLTTYNDNSDGVWKYIWNDAAVV